MRSAARLALVATLFAAGCQGSQHVIPFPDAGDPCAAGAHIDCAEFPDRTCVVDAGACGTRTYGCVDGGYFASDASACGLDGGGD